MRLALGPFNTFCAAKVVRHIWIVITILFKFQSKLLGAISCVEVTSDGRPRPVLVQHLIFDVKPSNLLRTLTSFLKIVHILVLAAIPGLSSRGDQEDEMRQTKSRSCWGVIGWW